MGRHRHPDNARAAIRLPRLWVSVAGALVLLVVGAGSLAAPRVTAPPTAATSLAPPALAPGLDLGHALALTRRDVALARLGASRSQRQAQEAEAARVAQEAARQEAEAARVVQEEAARQEAARQEAARQEAARQEAARQEAEAARVAQEARRPPVQAASGAPTASSTPWRLWAPHVRDAVAEVLAQFAVPTVYTRPDHSPTQALAADFMTYGDTALGDAVADYLIANADRLRVEYVIFRQRIYMVSDPGWVPMEDRGSPTANHYDHPHASFLG